MQFCLVSPPTIVEFDPDLPESALSLQVAEGAPLGILSLAAVLEAQVQTPQVVDLNELHLEYRRSDAADQGVDLCEYALEALLQHDFDAIGFGSICSSYPLTLRIAEGLRQRRPDVPILFGGPQASVVDVATLENFPAVDIVVRGEAEQTLPELLTALERGADLTSIPGLAFRKRGEVIQTPPAPLLEDLDQLPLPAYHLHPFVGKASWLSLELGRGCPYACTFCSTNDFFRRRFRLKSPERLLEEMGQLQDEYGVDYFDLVHDMFTVDRRRVVEFCDAMIASGQNYQWHCSARTDRVDEELLSLMSQAGCTGIFFGIETGSASLQKEIKKRLDLEQARAHIRAASDLGIGATVSLITGFPDESESDFRDTVDFFIDALRCEETEPQLHLLAPLADTPLHRQFQGQLVLDEAFSDMSERGFGQDPADRQLITDLPDVFPNFYGVPTPLCRLELAEVRAFLLAGSNHFRWLLIALHQDAGSIVDVFREFRSWRQRAPGGITRESPPDGVSPEMGTATDLGYYQTAAFRREFCDFVRARSPRRPATATSFSALLKLSAMANSASKAPPQRPPEAPTPTMDSTSAPRLAPGVQTAIIGVDYPSLMRHLKDNLSLEQVPRGRRTVVSRSLSGKPPEVSQMSGMLASLLELCDGARTIQDIGECLAGPKSETESASPTRDCRLGLFILRDQGFVEV